LNVADFYQPARRLPTIESQIVPGGLTLKVEEYWRSLLADREMPARCDVDPAGLGRLLPNIFLIDVIGGPPRFRWRLIGTGIDIVEGCDHTGKWLDETIAHPEDPILSGCRQTEAERRPTYHAAGHRDLEGKPRRLVRVLLPLSEDGRTVNMLLGATDYRPGEAVAPPPIRTAAQRQAALSIRINAATPMPHAAPR
jgi:hypothetical protein